MPDEIKVFLLIALLTIAIGGSILIVGAVSKFNTDKYVICLRDHQYILWDQGDNSLFVFKGLTECDQYLPGKK